MKVQLIDANKERLNDLKHALSDLPQIGFIEVEKAAYIYPPRGLDMIFLTLVFAAEEWNADIKSRTAQILTTPPEKQEKGFPPLIVTGVNLTPEDPKDPLSQVRIVLESVFDAVRGFDRTAPGKVKYLGFWVMDLTRGVTVTQLSELLHRLLQNETTDP
ncbi:MAG TPA: hypothetical protein VMV34_09140 [Terriglobia bacterium]|nr:hypothetical protein [Terriglobia bacterium]